GSGAAVGFRGSTATAGARASGIACRISGSSLHRPTTGICPGSASTPGRGAGVTGVDVHVGFRVAASHMGIFELLASTAFGAQAPDLHVHLAHLEHGLRSEERRVGKECGLHSASVHVIHEWSLLIMAKLV